MPLFRARSRSGDSSAVSTTASHISPVTACKSGITPRDGPTGGYKNGDDSTSCKGTATSSSRSTFADEAAGESRMCTGSVVLKNARLFTHLFFPLLPFLFISQVVCILGQPPTRSWRITQQYYLVILNRVDYIVP